MSRRFCNAFPRNGEGFFNRESFREKKKTSADLGQYNQILSDITYAFQNPEVVSLIEKILGLDAIKPDPVLYAGGLSMMFPDDYFNHSVIF